MIAVRSRPGLHALQLRLIGNSIADDYDAAAAATGIVGVVDTGTSAATAAKTILARIGINMSAEAAATAAAHTTFRLICRHGTSATATCKGLRRTKDVANRTRSAVSADCAWGIGITARRARTTATTAVPVVIKGTRGTLSTGMALSRCRASSAKPGKRLAPTATAARSTRKAVVRTAGSARVESSTSAAAHCRQRAQKGVAAHTAAPLVVADCPRTATPHLHGHFNARFQHKTGIDNPAATAATAMCEIASSTATAARYD